METIQITTEAQSRVDHFKEGKSEDGTEIGDLKGLQVAYEFVREILDRELGFQAESYIVEEINPTFKGLMARVCLGEKEEG